MKKETFITLLCSGLMLVTPFTTIAQENKVSNNLSEKQDIDNLVNQIRVVIDEVLHKYGFKPMVAYLCNYILGILDDFIFQAVCILLLILSLPVQILLLLLAFIFRDHAYEFWGWMLLIATTWDLECAHYFSKSIQPLRTISILIKTNDISNPENDCPCLQG